MTGYKDRVKGNYKFVSIILFFKCLNFEVFSKQQGINLPNKFLNLHLSILEKSRGNVVSTLFSYQHILHWSNFIFIIWHDFL